VIIGNNPGFNPGAHGRVRVGIKRGRRFWYLLLGAGVLGGAGWIALQLYVQSWHHEVKAETSVKESQASLPVYKIPANLPVHEPPQRKEPPAREPVATRPPLPAPEPARPQRQPARAKAQLPSQIAWTGAVQGEPPSGWFVDGRRPMLAKGCALRPGASLIMAVLNTVVQSEVAGQVIATVSGDVENVDGVIDPETGKLKTLIHDGTKLVGLYKSDLTLGSRRLGMVWTELTQPDGSQLSLDQSSGMDVAGSMGVGGIVTTNWGQVIATAALFSLFDVAQRETVADGSYQGDVADAAASQFSKTGQQVVKQMLEQAVKIRIPAGTQIVVSVNKTIQVC
jgi:type IV secretion system protein VirB10